MITVHRSYENVSATPLSLPPAVSHDDDIGCCHIPFVRVWERVFSSARKRTLNYARQVHGYGLENKPSSGTEGEVDQLNAMVSRLSPHDIGWLFGELSAQQAIVLCAHLDDKHLATLYNEVLPKLREVKAASHILQGLDSRIETDPNTSQAIDHNAVLRERRRWSRRALRILRQSKTDQRARYLVPILDLPELKVMEQDLTGLALTTIKHLHTHITHRQRQALLESAFEHHIRCDSNLVELVQRYPLQIGAVASKSHDFQRCLIAATMNDFHEGHLSTLNTADRSRIAALLVPKGVESGAPEEHIAFYRRLLFILFVAEENLDVLNLLSAGQLRTSQLELLAGDLKIYEKTVTQLQKDIEDLAEHPSQSSADQLHDTFEELFHELEEGLLILNPATELDRDNLLSFVSDLLYPTSNSEQQVQRNARLLRLVIPLFLEDLCHKLEGDRDHPVLRTLLSYHDGFTQQHYDAHLKFIERAESLAGRLAHVILSANLELRRPRSSRKPSERTLSNPSLLDSHAVTVSQFLTH